MLCQCLLYNNVNELYVYECPVLFSLPPTPQPTPLGDHRAELSSLWYTAAPTSYFTTYGSIYISLLPSPFVPSSPSPRCVHKSFSVSASLLLPCKQVHRYHLSRFSVFC